MWWILMVFCSHPTQCDADIYAVHYTQSEKECRELGRFLYEDTPGMRGTWLCAADKTSPDIWVTFE